MDFPMCDGTIIDRTHSKYWKNQDLDLKTCGSLCAGSGAFVHHAANGNMGRFIYAFVTYNIMNTVVYTAISQPFHALGISDEP